MNACRVHSRVWNVLLTIPCVYETIECEIKLRSQMPRGFVVLCCVFELPQGDKMFFQSFPTTILQDQLICSSST